MFGNILNNAQIFEMRSKGILTFEPWQDERMKLAHYALTPSQILWAGDIIDTKKREYEQRHNFHNSPKYQFQENEYAIVEVEELIVLPDGILGHFLASSSLIQQGFGITAGKIDPGYGALNNKTQKIQFGVKNLRGCKNTFNAEINLAHVYFVDLRGLNNKRSDFTHKQRSEIIARFEDER